MVGIGHTPGPWLVDPNYVGDIITSDGVDLATTWHEGNAGNSAIIADSVGADYEQMQANAILTAAAPDLLEALRNFTDGRDLSYVDALEAARAAITKATGQ